MKPTKVVLLTLASLGLSLVSALVSTELQKDQIDKSVEKYYSEKEQNLIEKNEEEA